jgi:hypothetical protein
VIFVNKALPPKKKKNLLTRCFYIRLRWCRLKIFLCFRRLSIDVRRHAENWSTQWFSDDLSCLLLFHVGQICRSWTNCIERLVNRQVNLEWFSRVRFYMLFGVLSNNFEFDLFRRCQMSVTDTHPFSCCIEKKRWREISQFKKSTAKYARRSNVSSEHVFHARSISRSHWNLQDLFNSKSVDIQHDDVSFSIAQEYRVV